MLRSIKELYGNKLGASDGNIGHLIDFYFDDQKWVIRYLIVDTGDWLPGRSVLIAPHAAGRLDQTRNLLHLNLTRKQIEKSPAMETRKPVSRQYEDDYYGYFGWPPYWLGDGLWGSSGIPMLKPPPAPLEANLASATGTHQPPTNPHLRSTQAVNGYHFQTEKGIIGHVCDFMIDAQSWAIGQLAVKTGHRLTGEEILVPTKEIRRISYEESTVFAYAGRETMELEPKVNLAPADALK